MGRVELDAIFLPKATHGMHLDAIAVVADEWF
jgi:hypothetical protein